eukprot:scaffold7052_cov254-Pinguiococcus_pyrenoidosus.AAC.16
MTAGAKSQIASSESPCPACKQGRSKDRQELASPAKMPPANESVRWKPGTRAERPLYSACGSLEGSGAILRRSLGEYNSRTARTNLGQFNSLVQ